MSAASDPLIVGILRGFQTGQTISAIEAAVRGGLKAVEITWNSPNAAEQISEARARFGGQCEVGAGTILNMRDLDAASRAGASFIVTPIVRREVIEECVRRKLRIIPGAFSPSEIASARDLGATMVKIFPAETLGPNYIKALRGHQADAHRRGGS
jgi:2-dehydro-3-deoxyphosphogluconate aldolase / (4S)-4-hydroxy-2-oxoglutarate aldolase